MKTMRKTRKTRVLELLGWSFLSGIISGLLHTFYTSDAWRYVMGTR